MKGIPRSICRLRSLGVLAFLLLEAFAVLCGEEALPAYGIDDWEGLSRFDSSLDRDTFLARLTGVGVVGGSWKRYLFVHETYVDVLTGGKGNPSVRVQFATSDRTGGVKESKRCLFQRVPRRRRDSLSGLHIAIDPGHIGGAWSVAEERHFSLNGRDVVKEGDLTLLVARHVARILSSHGAKVTLVRDDLEPVSPQNRGRASEMLRAPLGAPRNLQLRRRTEIERAEIVARAELVNSVARPDMVLCLHFDAAASGVHDPLVPNNYMHVLINGAYTEHEFADPESRLLLMNKLFDGSLEESYRIAASTAASLYKHSRLPPYRYSATADFVLPQRSEYVWARNLLAPRLYRCPTVYVEAYVLNSHDVYPRAVQGDYDGFRCINGRMRRSLIREYASGVAEGVMDHYRSK